MGELGRRRAPDLVADCTRPSPDLMPDETLPSPEPALAEDPVMIALSIMP